MSERGAADSRARLQALTTRWLPFCNKQFFFQIVFCFQLSFARLSNLESENLELNQQVGELGRALGQEAAAYQAQVLMLMVVELIVTILTFAVSPLW